MKNIESKKELSEQIRNTEMETSKNNAAKLMENWQADRFVSKNSGSYREKSTEELSEKSNRKFHNMEREDLINFIFDEEEIGSEILDKYSKEDLIEIATEKNAKISELESVEENKAIPQYKSFGVKSSISRLTKSPIYEHASFKQLITKYKNLMESQRLAESIIIENFVSDLGNFEWDDVAKKERNILIKNLNGNLEDVYVEKAIFSIKRSSGWKFYGEAADIMNEWLQTENRSNKLLTKNLRTWAFNPIIGNLVNKLNEMESIKTGSLNIPSQQGESFVSGVYSPILLEENSTYFTINGKYFKANKNGIVTVNENNLSEDFKSLTRSFLNKNVKVNENGLSYYVGKERVSIVSENDKNNIYVNSTKLTFDNKNMLAKLLESNFGGIFNSGDAKAIADIINLYENFNNIVELDFIKSVKSRIYEGAEVNLIKWEDKIYLNKVNPAMNENSLYPASGRQAVKFVKEYLNYDISEGLTDYLEGDDRIKSVMVNDRSKVLENLKNVENQLAKINLAIQTDPRLAESEEIKAAKSILENDIDNLKSKWSIINSEIEKIDTIDFESIQSLTEDEKFNIGSLVKVKESGDTGKVISIDGSGGRYTVLHDNGQTGDYTLEEIADIDTTLSQTSGEGKDDEADNEEDLDSTGEKE